MQLETPTCNAINIQKLCLKHDLTGVATILTTTISSQSSEPQTCFKWEGTKTFVSQ